MIVRFYEMTCDGEAVVGDIRLVDGKLVADPPDRIALSRLISEPFELWDPTTGERTYIEPSEEPERFLEGCLETYRGSYFWCKLVED